jgi:hypothetical protein
MMAIDPIAMFPWIIVAAVAAALLGLLVLLLKGP